MLLSQLEYLTALARECHFARAAKACFVSQPALSAAIRKLETEFQVPIVKRGNRFMGFTPEGERIVSWAQRVLAERDALVDNVNTMREGLSGCLRIGAIPTTLSSISLLTTPFSLRYPLVWLSITSMSSVEIQRSLSGFEIDVGATYIDNEPLANVRKIPLYEERYLLLTSAEGRFADRDSLTWFEAAQIPLCLLSPDMQNRRILNEAFRKAGCEPTPTVETNSVTALCSHVRDGAWSAVMSHAWLYLSGVPDGMRAIPLVEPEISQQVGLVVYDREPEPVLARALLETARGLDIQSHLEQTDPGGPSVSPAQRNGDRDLTL
ncbi:LysR family transcriptional regulator [Allosalinactinospora lopnorensis]|uniref:LysR family transcriptional regulator n=1 Tax=Allosalinactinospora lopnorensis TaxID=1352348 RepID=UPI000623D76B|nr:LysR family transcriptional regulator [Allosalinactinospora lopnorensis]